MTKTFYLDGTVACKNHVNSTLRNPDAEYVLTNSGDTRQESGL